MTKDYLSIISDSTTIMLVTITLMRILVLALFYALDRFATDNGQLATRIAEDPWHHYHIGLLLILVGLVLHKTRKSAIMIAIGLGIFLEEWALFIHDLGFQTNQLYLSKIDFVTIAVPVGLIYISTRLLTCQQYLSKL